MRLRPQVHLSTAWLMMIAAALFVALALFVISLLTHGLRGGFGRRL